MSMEMSVRVIFSGSSGLFWSVSQACIMTSSKAGSPSETPTSSALLLPPCHRWGCDLGFLWASLALLDFLHFCFQWPIFWQEWQVESFAGQCSLPGVWRFVQLPHGALCVDDFFIVFCSALMAFVDRPIEDMLSAIAMCVRHTASISAVVASIFITKNFLIRSVLLRVWTIRNWMCLSFSASVGKLIYRLVLRFIQQFRLESHQLLPWSLPTGISCISEIQGDPWSCVETP